MTDTAISKDGSDPFWSRVRSALGALRPVRQQRERAPAYGQAAIARTLGMRTRLGTKIDEELAQSWSRSAERNVSLSLLVVEMDRSKEYFTAYGKASTDDCLSAMQAAIRHCLPREGDKCLRLGRHGFVVVLPDFPVLMARSIAAKISAAIRSEGLAHKESHAGIVTACIGLAVSNPQGGYDKKFFETAAEALKKAQRRGLGRIEAVDLRPAQQRKRKAG